MQEFQRRSSLCMPMLLLLLLLLVSPATAELPMQLSREELVRLAGYGEDRLSSVLVTGTLLCDACLKRGGILRTSTVAGAKIAVACKTEGKNKMSWVTGTTDEYGEFVIDLPSQLHAIPGMEEACMVRVLDVPENSSCRRFSSYVSKEITLSSIGNSIRVYSTGAIRLRHPSIFPRRQCLRMEDE